MTGFGLRHRPYLLAAALLGLGTGALAALLGASTATAILVGWCLGAIGHMALTDRVMALSSPKSIRRRAAQLDEGETAVLAATLIAAIASLGAVLWYLAARAGAVEGRHIALALATIAISWCFVHMLFAVRYAHEYWQADGGVEFPGGEKPIFSDFLYLAFTIGMTFQTSDVAFRAKGLRRLTLLHALVAFLFNVVIVAAAVNLASGLVH